MEELLKEWPFDTVGDFLQILFYNPTRSEPDLRGTTHASAVSQFLRGRTSVRMCDILPLMYYHRASYPSSQAVNSHEQDLRFSTSIEPERILHARPFISTWAVRLVAAEARKQVGRMANKSSDEDEHQNQLRASTNGRRETKVVTWNDLLANFNMNRIHELFGLRMPLPIFLTEAMAAPKSNGVYFVRKRRPHPMIQVGALASFIISRNRYANAPLAMVFGVFFFACKVHIDVKRVFCRLGYSVADSTARDALVSATAADFVVLRTTVADAEEREVTEGFMILDNCQEYADVWEQGIGRQSQLKVGTAGTYVWADDVAPGAFDAKPYYDNVAKKERMDLTTDSLFDDIQWPHIRRVIPLHWTRVLVEFYTGFEPLLDGINKMFRTAPVALHRMREGRKTRCQPLGTNSEHSTELQGMARAVEDFDQQIGIKTHEAGKQLHWIRGDGASFANLHNLSTYMAPLYNFKNKISTPEIWHTGATDLNSTAANHYGPATSRDPSSLSRCSNVAGFKRPSNVKSCDYYPTVRNFTLIWTAHVLDCWRIFFGVDDLQKYLDDLAARKTLPDLPTLIRHAETLADRYASQGAINASLSEEETTDPERVNQIPEMPGLVEIDTEPATPRARTVPLKESDDDAPKVHKEKSGFTGDRVLRNSQIFMQDFGWWIEFAHAVPEGDIGRVWEIMKIWIFKFAGSSHHNYVNYLLEVYCMLRYEASKDLRNAILNNWLLNIKGELGHWIPGDLHQEHYIKWLKEMIRRHGGEFDDPFYRKTISPNVHHFIQIKEEVEAAFDLERRSQKHTSPHQRDE
ncbi:hypothetical protein R3P38DRAFT_2740578, partial [Favolaschia claudopus]